MTGSKLVMVEPMPSVELTKPLVPVPMPLARNGGSTGAGAHRAAEAAHAAAGSVLHDAGIDAENVGARLGAQVIGVGDVEVVAGDIEVEIVLQSERNGVVDRKINLAVAHQRVDARRVAQVRAAPPPAPGKAAGYAETPSAAWNNPADAPPAAGRELARSAALERLEHPARARTAGSCSASQDGEGRQQARRTPVAAVSRAEAKTWFVSLSRNGGDRVEATRQYRFRELDAKNIQASLHLSGRERRKNAGGDCKEL